MEEKADLSQNLSNRYIPDVLPWINAGGRTEANIRRINLQHNKKYKVWVRATNGVGLKSIGSSDELLVDTTPPTKPEITLLERTDIGYYPNSLHFIFSPGEDQESGIVHNYFALGSERGKNDLFDWTEVTTFDIEIANLPIKQGDNVWLTVESYNGAGLKSTRGKSVLINYSDSTPPETPTVVTLPTGYTSKTDSISIGWNIVYDCESGIVKYEYGLGTNAQSPDIVSWQVSENEDKPILLATKEEASEFAVKHQASNKGERSSRGAGDSGNIKVDNSSQVTVTHIVSGGLTTDFVKALKNLSLRGGNSYYAFVRVTNGAGLTSRAVSLSLLVDTTKPEVNIEGPESVTLNINWELPVTVHVRDNESGIYKYRYAVWRIENLSKIDEIQNNLYAYAGVGDVGENIIIASSNKEAGKSAPAQNIIPQASIDSGQTQGRRGNIYQQVIKQAAPELKAPAEEIQPWMIENATPPWAQSGWIKLSTGIPPKEEDFHISIKSLPHPGLKGGESYRIKVWVMNGAGIIGGSNSIIIHAKEIPGVKKQNVPKSAK
ncbi:MAG: hypothetical protein DRO93_16040, partial [Candidatus Thorarchaeota archaeon]